MKLKELFRELLEDYGLLALKFGTEYEEMSFEEMEYILELTEGKIPVYVKIGGVDARNDINNLLRIGIHNFIAPMVESPYALKNFITTLKELTGSLYPVLKKGVNIETIYAFYNFDAIIKSESFKELDQVTLARSDFSRSIEKRPDDEEVFQYMINMRNRPEMSEKTVIVGGTITPRNSVEIVKRIKPHRIDTRMFIVDATDESIIAESVYKCLNLEKALYTEMSKLFTYREGFIETILNRLDTRMADIPKLKLKKAVFL